MRFNIITAYPDMFPGTLGHSLAAEARSRGLWSLETINIRDFGMGNYKHIDDTPYGGGAGMVIRPDVLGAAIESKPATRHAKLIYMSPRGIPLNQQRAKDLAKRSELTILCGRFEGVDERVLDYYDFEEISIGDYVLSGGEPAAIILMDTVIRLLPDVMGNPETLNEESFSNGLLEYPHYTRPAVWNDIEVPEVLQSGNHAKIAQWRKERSLELTKLRRPDLVSKK